MNTAKIHTLRQNPQTFTPTRDMILAAKAVFMTRAMVDMIRPIVENYQRQALDEIGWSGMDINHTYQLPDETWQKYHALCVEKRKTTTSLHVKSDEYCPLLVAQHEVTLAEHALFDAMFPITGITVHGLLCLGLEKYREYINLTLRLLAIYIK